MKKVLIYIFTAFIFLSCDTETSSEYTMYIEVADKKELNDFMEVNWYGKTLEDFAQKYGNYSGDFISSSGRTSVYWRDIVKKPNRAGKFSYASLYLDFNEDNTIFSHSTTSESTVSGRRIDED